MSVNNNQVPSVTQIVTQTSVFNSYNPGATICSNCAASTSTSPQVPCNDGDWAYQKVTCCAGQSTTQLSCSALDPSTCPTIPGVTVTPSWNTAPSVACTYPVSEFTSVEATAAFLAAFGANSNYNTQVAPFFCSQSSSSCPANPQTGVAIPSCSMYWDTGAGGKLCQSWATSNPALATTTFTNYCTTENTPDCTVLTSPYVKTSSSSSSNWWSSWGWIVVVVVAVAIFVGLLIWFAIVMSKNAGTIRRIEEGHHQQIKVLEVPQSYPPPSIVVQTPSYPQPSPYPQTPSLVAASPYARSSY